MDESVRAAARDNYGIVGRADLGSSSGRAARRARLREVQPGAFLAHTQPYDVATQLASLQVSHPDGDWFVMTDAALWLYGIADLPARLEIGTPLTSELAVRAPVRCRRVAASVLQGARTLQACRVVALEVAVIQWAEGKAVRDVVAALERLVRERRTTIARLRGRLRRGFAGSAVVRRAIGVLAGGSLEQDVRRLAAALRARGVTGLEVEVWFQNAAGASAYADLLDRRTMTVIEVDAASDHLERQRFRADRRRDRWLLREHGVRTLRVDVTEIREDLTSIADELAAFLLQQQDAKSGGTVAS